MFYVGIHKNGNERSLKLFKLMQPNQFEQTDSTIFTLPIVVEMWGNGNCVVFGSVVNFEIIQAATAQNVKIKITEEFNYK